MDRIWKDKIKKCCKIVLKSLNEGPTSVSRVPQSLYNSLEKELEPLLNVLIRSLTSECLSQDEITCLKILVDELKGYFSIPETEVIYRKIPSPSDKKVREIAETLNRKLFSKTLDGIELDEPYQDKSYNILVVKNCKDTLDIGALIDYLKTLSPLIEQYISFFITDQGYRSKVFVKEASTSHISVISRSDSLETSVKDPTLYLTMKPYLCPSPGLSISSYYTPTVEHEAGSDSTSQEVDKGGNYNIVDNAGNLIGIVIYQILYDEVKGIPYTFLYLIEIDDKKRGKGYATQVVKFLFDLTGVSEVRGCHVADSLDFWARLGALYPLTSEPLSQETERLEIARTGNLTSEDLKHYCTFILPRENFFKYLQETQPRNRQPCNRQPQDLQPQPLQPQDLHQSVRTF